jgi:tripartite motif-containing protein 71
MYTPLKNRKSTLTVVAVLICVVLFLILNFPGIAYSQSEEIINDMQQIDSSESEALQGNTFTVDSSGDEPDKLIDGICETALNTCTLRAAIQEANVNSDQDRINFNISTSEPGYRDNDILNSPGSGNSQGQNDYWVINYSGKSSELFVTAVVIDVSSQTRNLFDSNKEGPEVIINFTKDNSVISQAIYYPEVLGASTIEPAGPPESSLRYKGKIGKEYNKNWELAEIAGIVNVGGYSYVVGKQTILKLDSTGNLVTRYDETSPTQGINNARCITTDNSGYLYVCDAANYNHSPNSTGVGRVQKFDTSGNYIATIGSYGSGLGQFTGISDVSFDSSNNMYVTDPDLLRVSKFDVNGNFLLTWGSSGTGNAQFGSGTLLSGGAQLIRDGMGIDLDSSNNVYVVDTGNRKIKKFDSSGNYINSWTTTEGSDPAVGFGMAAWDVFIDSSDRIYDIRSGTFNQAQVGRIQQFDTSGNLIGTSWGRGGPTVDRFDHPTEIYFDNGIFYIADSYDGSYIQMFDSSHNHLGWWGYNPGDYRNFLAAWGLKFDSAGNLYATDFSAKSVKKFDLNLNGISTWYSVVDGMNITNPGNVQFVGVVDVDIDSQGYVYIFNFNAGRMDKLDPNTGAIILSWSTPNTGTGIAIDHNDNIYINQRTTNTVRKYTTSGVFLSSFGGTGTGNGQFTLPGRLAIDSQNNIYATDQNNCNVQKFDPSGAFLLKWGSCGAGNSQFSQPYDAIVDPEDNIWIVDRGNNSIKKFDSTGNYITKWNGTGLTDDTGLLIGGFSGTGLNGLELSGTGDIYVSMGQADPIIQIFSYDQTGPVIDVTEFENNVTANTAPTITGVVSDSLSPVISLQFTLNSDYSALQNCAPDDGIFDEKSEAFSCSLGNLSFGQHTVYLKATDNANNTTNGSYTFSIVDPTIQLVSPLNNAVIDNPLPLLDWNSAFTADSYKIYLDDNLIVTTEGSGTSYRLVNSQRLQYDSRHTWKVQGFIGSSMIAESSSFSFSVVPPTFSFAPVYPVNVTIDDFTPLFDWTDIPAGSDATSYEIYVDDELVATVAVGTSEYQLPDDKALGEGDHTWKVKAYFKDVDDKLKLVGETTAADFLVKLSEPGQIIPPQTGSETPSKEIERFPNISTLTPLLPLGGYASLGAFALFVSLISVGLGNTIKRVEVILSMFIPKKRKYWGIVFDENNLKQIAFAVVTLADLDDKIINTTVTDLNGRYGFLVESPGEYILTLGADGFNSYSGHISVDPEREIVKDIPLRRRNALPNIANRLKFYLRNNFLPIMNIVGLIVMLIGLLWTTYYMSKDGVSGLTLIGAIIYISLFIVNILLLAVSVIKEIGKVKDMLTGNGVGGASVRFYDREGQVDLAITNSKGEIKMNIKPGKYKVRAYKSGYKHLGDLEEIKLKQEGYLESDINLQKIDGNPQDNPFNRSTGAV